MPRGPDGDPVMQHTRDVYSQDEIVQVYADESIGLMPGERAILDEHLTSGASGASGASVLDLGVGGGRTTGYLAERASRYVGLDYSPAMVAACRQRFPDLEFVFGDAADLSAFADGEFDVVVFSWNGIDHLHPERNRARCFAEIHRVLRSGGLFTFSSHNARYLLQRPNDRPVHVRRLVRPAYLRTVVQAALPGIRRLGWRAFWEGHGYVQDHSNGDVTTYVATARIVAEEGRRAGFEPLAVVPSTYPEMAPSVKVSWWYYAWSRP